MRRHEARTSAEICVVLAPRSGSYRDLSLLVGLASAWSLLAFLVLSPLSFSPLAALVELPVATAAVTWLTHRSPWLLRRLSRVGRRASQVDRAAAAAFHEEGVHLTRERTGLLVYVSLLEGRVAVLPDAAIEGCIPAARWRDIRWGDGPGLDQQALLAGLDEVGDILAAALPATGDNPNEVPDAPRLRPGLEGG